MWGGRGEPLPPFRVTSGEDGRGKGGVGGWGRVAIAAAFRSLFPSLMAKRGGL